MSSIPEALKAPLVTHLEVTWRCNHNCVFCYNAKNIAKASDPSEKRITALVGEMIEAPIAQLMITGGEPLLRKNLVKKLVEKTKNSELKVSVNTNGSLLKRFVCDKTLPKTSFFSWF